MDKLKVDTWTHTLKLFYSKDVGPTFLGKCDWKCDSWLKCFHFATYDWSAQTQSKICQTDVYNMWFLSLHEAYLTHYMRVNIVFLSALISPALPCKVYHQLKFNNICSKCTLSALMLMFGNAELSEYFLRQNCPNMYRDAGGKPRAVIANILIFSTVQWATLRRRYNGCRLACIPAQFATGVK